MDKIKSLIDKSAQGESVTHAHSTPLKDPSTFLSSSSKKISKPKVEKVRVKAIRKLGYPERVDPKIRSTRRFSVSLKYDGEDGKTHQRTIKFGKIGVPEFIDGGVPETYREEIISNLKHKDDPLHEDFYRAYILNSKERNYELAFKNLKEKLGIL